MRTLTPLFDIEKTKKIGAKPVWILKCPFVSGTIYLSDRDFTYTGITIKPWVESWGAIDENLSSDMAMPMISDFSVNIIVDPDEATDIHDLLWSENVETIDCELYLWFEGLTVATDPMLLIWSGNIIDFERINELVYNVRLVDESVRIDKNVGTVLSLADYPNASLDDVGYTLPVLYGSIEKSPALRLDIGKKTTLIAAIDGDDVDFYLSDGTGFANGTNIVIDYEEIQITTISGNHITACVRAYNSTTASNHNAGTLVLENQAVCVFMFANHPVKSIGNIYARRPLDGVLVDVTSICTKYTGQGGANDYTGYAGKAVITCPGYITFDQATDLGLIDTIDFDAYTNDEAIETRFGEHAPVTNSTNVHNPEGMSSALAQEQWVEIAFSINITLLPTTGTFYIYVYVQKTHGVSDFTPYIVAEIKSTGLRTIISSPLITTIPVDRPFASEPCNVCIVNGNQNLPPSLGVWYTTLNWAKFSVRRPIAVTLTKAGTVTLTGEGVASVAVGDNILISGEGYQDDGSGTYTGTASALIERPDHVFKHLLYTQASWPVANFITDAAASFAADSYAFSVVINTRKKLKEWLAYMALQCRCWFRFMNGNAYLLYRPDSISSDKTIVKFADNDDFTTTMKTVRSKLDEIINVVHLYYQRDWTKAPGREAYQAVTKAQDNTSIAAYGEKEKADAFLFDFVQDDAMAVDLRDFYLARYKDRKKVISGVLFLDHMEVEFGDGVTLTEAGGVVCEVQKIGFSPGSATTMDSISLVARQY